MNYHNIELIGTQDMWQLFEMNNLQTHYKE